MLNDGIEGFCFTAGDTGQLTERLRVLANDPALRTRMSDAALARVKLIGGWSSYGRDYISVINNLLIS
jgi:alpha-maltose-1-phosphate synthase